MFIAALFYKSQDIEVAWVFTINECLKKLWYMCTMEYYAAIKGTESCHL